jgi:hypothetical protein
VHRAERCISVKTDLGREHFQKKVLKYNLREVHQMFCAETNMKVGFTKFSSIRPQHVMLTGQKGQEVCMCEYHENLDMCHEGLRKTIPLQPAM